MAAYCSLAQVQALLTTIQINGTSHPNQEQVILSSEMVAGEIDSALSSIGIEVPVTGPSYWLLDITRLNAVGVASQILMAAFPATSGPGSSSQASVMWKSYQDRLAQIRKGETIPSGAGVEDDSPSTVRSLFTDLEAVGSSSGVDWWGQEVNSAPAVTREQVF